jgi:hypothetical protein
VAKSRDGDQEHAPLLVVKVEPDKPEPPPAAPHIVRLHFAEPQDLAVGERVFDVMLGEQVVERDLDIIRDSGAPRTALVREYRDVMLQDTLTVTFHPKRGEPILSGVEIIRQD